MMRSSSSTSRTNGHTIPLPELTVAPRSSLQRTAVCVHAVLNPLPWMPDPGASGSVVIQAASG